MNKGLNTIETGTRVAIIGGGPAGSFFALYLLHYAREEGIQPDITIYEQRDMNELGPKGCKGCAGILSRSTLRKLDELSLALPEEVIQSRIENYVVHSPSASISISNPEKGAKIISIYRGGGPRLSHYENRISFDGWLLRQAQERGVRVVKQRVSRISLEQEAS
jgi:flavin-dependent dehydrogenase